MGARAQPVPPGPPYTPVHERGWWVEHVALTRVDVKVVEKRRVAALAEKVGAAAADGGREGHWEKTYVHVWATGSERIGVAKCAFQGP